MYKVKIETNSFGNDLINDVNKVKVETNNFGNDSWSMMCIRWKWRLIVLVMIVDQWCE